MESDVSGKPVDILSLLTTLNGIEADNREKLGSRARQIFFGGFYFILFFALAYVILGMFFRWAPNFSIE